MSDIDVSRMDAMENGLNFETAADLRDVADWLERHPELPEVAFASVMIRYPGFGSLRMDAREALTAVARAFGDKATETVEFGREVQIARKFGKVHVKAHASIDELGGFASVTSYEPIIAPPVEVNLPVTVGDMVDGAVVPGAPAEEPGF